MCNGRMVSQHCLWDIYDRIVRSLDIVDVSIERR